MRNAWNKVMQNVSMSAQNGSAGGRTFYAIKRANPEYTDEEIVNIINKYDSITSYEYYVLNLMLGLFKSKSIKNGSPIDTSNYERFIKEKEN